VAVDDATHQLREPNRLALRLAGGVGETVHQWHIRAVEDVGRGLDRVVHAGFLAVDEGIGIEPLRGVVLEPRFTQDAGALGLDDAADLGRQIEEISPTPRKVVASVGGDGGRVLSLEGDIDAEEGDRLTTALRADLQELGFKRVEGGTGSTTWWSRV
jgi:hypothetical protein